MNTDTGYVPMLMRGLVAYNVQKVLPAVYDDSLSYYEILAKVQAKLNESVTNINNLNEWQAAQDEVMAELNQMVEDFIAGGYKADFDKLAREWLDANIRDALTRGTRMVFFGLTDDGYFTAYVPTEWSFAFDTVMNYDDANYGSLAIKY